uniref:Tachylectin 2 domain-containing protein n=1 Tax=Leptobrachium leishanense TaxID=445787 RepID=A0A8C5QH09_9ANUR
MDTPDAVLLVVKDYIAKAGLPPKNMQDNFDVRSTVLGKMNAVTKIVFNPAGDLYAVRGIELYRGSMPSSSNQDWFSTAKRVGKTDWDKYKCLFFDPQGVLYAATKNGELYKGPAPSNENVSWLYGEATKVGTGGWNLFDALFFDLKGIMYGVTDKDKLVMRSPPTKPDDDWLSSSTTIGTSGWRVLSHFIAVSPDHDLWCVDSRNGSIYKGPIPTKDDPTYQKKAVQLGWGYNAYPFMSFTLDKIMEGIVSFEFLPDVGKILSQNVEVVQSQIYNNKSSSPLKHTFTFSKIMTETSTFSQEHGFTLAVGAEMTFKAGIPLIAEIGLTISVNVSTTHTWNFTKTNTTETTFSSSTDVEVPPMRCIRMMASVTKAEMNVPFTAVIRTRFGYTSTIKGTWKGATHYNLMVTQEDYKC